MLIGYRTKIACGIGVAYCLWQAWSCPQTLVYPQATSAIDPAAWEWIAWAIEFAALYFFAAKFPPGFFPQVIALLKDLLPLFLRLIEVLRTVEPKPTPEPPPVFQYVTDPTPQPVFHVPTHMEPPAGGVGRRVEPLPGGMTATKTASGATTIGCLALILGLAATASAAPPKAVIQGSDPSAAGEIIVLDAASSEGEPTHFSWDITPEIRGRRQKLEVESSKRVIVASFPGRYIVTLTVSNAEGHSTAHKEIVIPGNAPVPPTPPAPTPEPQPVPPLPTPPVPPGPGPAPTPTPAPPVPPSRYGLDTLVTGWAAGIPEADRIAYAGVCESVAAVIVATPANFTGDPNEVAKKVAAALTNAVTAAKITPSLQLVGVLGRLSLWIKTRSKEKGDLKTGEDFAVVLREVAAGLRGVR